MVLIGVAGELVLLIKKFPFNPTSFPPIESLKKRLEVGSVVILILGLLVELVILPHSLLQVAGLNKEAADVRLKAAKLEQQIELAKPENQPIGSLTATVVLTEQGTNRTNVDPSKTATDAAFVKLLIGCSKHLTNGFPVGLFCTSCDRFPLSTSSVPDTATAWILEFGTTGLAHLESIIPQNATVRDANEWDIIEFDAPFLRPGTEIYGDITLTINSTIKKFEIPQQKIQSAKEIWPSAEQKGQDNLTRYFRVSLTNPVTVVSW